MSESHNIVGKVRDTVICQTSECSSFAVEVSSQEVSVRENTVLQHLLQALEMMG